MDYQTLEVSRDPRGVLSVAFNRPEVRNAFNDVVMDELAQVFQGPALEADVRAVVLRGNGPVFCAGGDLNWMKKAIDFSYDENLRDTRKLARMFNLLNEFEKPVIGAVHGAAIGGGVGLVSVCDIVVATRSTVFSFAEVRLGIVPACIGPFVVAKVGGSWARELFLSADRFDAAKAREIGLIHYLADDEKALSAEVERILGNILHCGPNALSVAKRLVHELAWPERRTEQKDCLEYVAKTLADLRISDEGQEGVRAFLEKRKPGWLPKG